MPNLVNLCLFRNKISGAIPQNIGNLANLEGLHLGENQLTGNIPESICSLSKLSSLILYQNRLTGIIPTNIGSLTQLQQIELSSNTLSGAIPESIGNLHNLTALNLMFNQLSGSIPKSIWNLNNLSHLMLSGNHLSGSIPADIGRLTNLTQIWLENNSLSGSIPAEIGYLTNLTMLLLSWNSFSGPIPPEIGTMTNLQSLWLYNNQLTGTIPAEIADIPELSTFECQNNYLSTDISDALRNHKHFSNWALTPQYQEDPNFYESTDYSYDGTVTQVLTCTVGDGVKLVITGDAFADRDFVASSGGQSHFDELVSITVDEFFKEEPYKSFRDRFDVYSVAAVSKYDVIGKRTAFNCQYGYGTFIQGNDSKVFDYAAKAVGYSALPQTLTMVILNDTKYAGTCYMYSDGSAIAYTPYVSGNSTDYGNTMRHEAGGHGFSKLMDEYYYSGTITADQISELNSLHQNGWAKNVDCTNKPNDIIWSKFLTNSLYTGQVGIFEGAYTVEFGAYRPTDYSIMRYNTGGFNAPSRESIYKRIMELSGEGYSWNAFVAYDAINRETQSSGVQSAPALLRHYEPLAPPVIVKGSWRDARALEAH